VRFVFQSTLKKKISLLRGHIMSQKMNLKEAERNVFKLAAFQDGWWDILFGGELIILSVYPISRQAFGPAWNLVLFFVALALLLTAVYTAKRVFVAPRIGSVKLGPNRTVRLGRVVGVTIFIATFIFFILTLNQIITEPTWPGAPAWLQNYDVDILFTLIIIGFFHFLGAIYGTGRLHLYGWLMGLGNLFSTILDHELGYTFHWPMLIAGIVIVLIGVIWFARFLRDYPAPVMEA
jgi:hypothetical protein